MEGWRGGVERSRTARLTHLLDDPTTAIAAGLIALQLGFRGWATFNGWFYADDFEFLTEAAGTDLSLRYLLTPHDSQLMPGGVLAMWLVAQSGAFEWSSAAVILTLLQTLASVLCWVMLCTLFRGRTTRLVLLALYLFSTLTLTAFMWWAAAINQFPLHAAFFAAVTFHVRHLQSRSNRSAGLVVASIALGLAFYVKAILIVIPLTVFSLLAGWTGRRPDARPILVALLKPWRVWLGLVPLGLLYTVYYVTRVPSPVVTGSDIDFGGLADAMFRRTMGPGLLGGPWKWDHLNPPLALVSTPEWVVTASWTLLLLLLVYLIRERRFDARGLLIAVPYLAIAYFLTATGRGAQLGGFAGLEPRYLADSVPVLVLSLGVCLQGLPENRTVAVAASPSSNLQRLAAAATTAFVIGALYSSIDYVRFWTSGFPAESFVKNVTAQARTEPMVVADQPVPEAVMPFTSYPSNLPSRLFKPLGSSVKSVTVGTDLNALDTNGTVHPAVVTPGRSASAGPRDDCGYLVRAEPVQVPLDDSPLDYFWWMELSYLSGDDGTIEVEIDGTSRKYPISGGLHRLFVQGEGGATGLTLRTSLGHAGLCVDSVKFGALEAFSIQ